MSTAVHMTRIFAIKGTMLFVVHSTYLMPILLSKLPGPRSNFSCTPCVLYCL